MDTKIGTQTWSSAPQTSSMKSDNKQLVSAKDKDKIGEKNVGDLLNKIADPNYQDHPRREVGKAQLDKDDFLKLLLTQMKYQDPMNPMDTQQMATQLAQFTSLEQLHNVNSNLTDLKKGQEPMQKYEALNLLGKSISSDSTRMTRIEGDKSHDMTFTLANDAVDVNLEIKNAVGEVVRKLDLKNLKKGDNLISWNGMDERGNKMAPGEYNFSISAKGLNDKKVNVTTAVTGKITGVTYTANGPVLMVGDKSVRLSEIHRIEDGELKQAQSKDFHNVTDQVLPQSDKKEQTDDKSVSSHGKKQITNGVAMAGALMEKVKSAGQKSIPTEESAAPTNKPPRPAGNFKKL